MASNCRVICCCHSNNFTFHFENDSLLLLFVVVVVIDTFAAIAVAVDHDVLDDLKDNCMDVVSAVIAVLEAEDGAEVAFVCLVLISPIENFLDRDEQEDHGIDVSFDFVAVEDTSQFKTT